MCSAEAIRYLMIIYRNMRKEENILFRLSALTQVDSE